MKLLCICGVGMDGLKGDKREFQKVDHGSKQVNNGIYTNIRNKEISC